MMYAFFLGMYSTYSKMQYVFTYYIIIYIKIDHFYSSHGTLQNVKLKTKRLCPQLARLKFTGGTLRYMRLNEYLQGALKAWENGRCLLCFFSCFKCQQYMPITNPLKPYRQKHF